MPSPGKYGLRRSGKPRRLDGSLPAFFLAGGQHDRGLRREGHLPGNSRYGERDRVGPIDGPASQRARPTAHQMLVHLRTEAHPIYRRPVYPKGRFGGEEDFTYQDNEERIERARTLWETTKHHARKGD